MTARLIKRGAQRPPATTARPVKRPSEREIRERWLAEKRLREAAELARARKALGRA